MSEIDRRINAAIGRLERLAVKLPAAVDALLDRRRKIDGWNGAGQVHVQQTAELTPTEASVDQRLHIDRLIANLYEEIDAIALTARNVEADCDRYLDAGRPIVDEPKPRCDGGAGYEGYLIPTGEGGWSNPECHNIPSEGRKTCDQCRGRASTWKRRNGNVTSNG